MKWKTAGKARILDFDTESLAAGFADPEWVPQKITCAAWSWTDEEHVEVRVGNPHTFFTPRARARMLKPFVAALLEADIITGHNIIRHDLPVINAECLRLGLGSLPSLMVQDTIRVAKTKGLKKGQDNIARLLCVPEEKMALDWQAWEDAYAKKGWPTVADRCMSDVVQHKQLRAAMLDAGWLKDPVSWRPQ
jgi:DNA polymerase elongation subunit (family B)